MRADRLLSILMLLQSRGRMTAARLAAELEVSERTIYRDIDALSRAGIPVYGERGEGGGFALLEGYRSNLTGLTDAELRALFMLGTPAPLADLGLDGELKGALLKLSAALPAGRRANEERVHQRFYLDATPRPRKSDYLSHLESVQEAVWKDRQLFIRSRLPYGVEIAQQVAPYGLVAKSGHWYLVYAHGGVRVRRLSDLLEVCLLDKSFTRPQDWDLPAFWHDWCRQAEHRPTYHVTARIAPALARLPSYLGVETEEIVAVDEEGWAKVSLSFDSFEAARERILGLGGAIEVLAPEPLRLSVMDFAQQVLGRYAIDDQAEDTHR